MEIKGIHNYNTTTKVGGAYYRFTPNAYKVSGIKNYPSLLRDSFQRQKPQITFTNSAFITKLMQQYLKNKSLNNSVTHSKRPYLSIDESLKDVLKPIKIKVNKTEEINAFDINPNNSKQYIIFLHGFSQNITSNQPLYKALKDTNYGVLAIDYRDYGTNISTKHTSEKCLFQDTKSAVKYLQDKGISSIGVLGHSFGGYLATKLTKAVPLDFQILVSPMLSLEFWLKNVIKNPKKHKQESKMVNYIPKFKNQYKKIFDISKNMEGNTTPTYIIQAFKDKYIRTSKVNEFAKKIANLQEYRILQTGGHRMDEDKIAAITDVIKHL